MKKKILIAVLSIIAVLGIAIGAIYIFKRNSDNSNPVKVISVSSFGGWYGDESNIEGQVSSSDEQSIYVTGDTLIKEVFVHEGQAVKKGDPLLEYDTTYASLQLNTKKAAVNLTKANIALAEKELRELRKIKPVEDNPTPVPQPEPDPVPPNTPTDADPEPEPEPPVDDPTDEITYTKQELAEAIKAKEIEIRDMQLQLKNQELQIEKENAKLVDGVVYSKMDGIVEKLDTSEENIGALEPVLTVKGDGYYTVRIYVDEMKLATIQPGTNVSVMCYENGNTYFGTVGEISTIPYDNYWNSDTISTFYPVTIDIEDGDGLVQGSWVQASLDPNANMSMGMMPSDKIVLSKVFVNEENGNYYVMKDDHGKLKKQYIKTGKIYWGSEIEVKSGLTQDDYIAFPYSKEAVEGRKTKVVSMDEFY